MELLLVEEDEHDEEQDDCEVVLGEVDCAVKEAGSWTDDALLSVVGPIPLLDEELSELTDDGRGEDDGVVELFEGVGLGVAAAVSCLCGSCCAHTSITMLDDDATGD